MATRRRRKKLGQIDDIDNAANNLELWVDNTEPLYRSKLAVFQNLKKKKKRGNYDSRRAPKAFSYLLEQAGKQMHKQLHYGGQWHRHFPKRARDMAAKELVAEFESEYERGALGAELKQHEPMKGGLAWLLLVGLGAATVGIVVAASRKNARAA